MARGSPTKSPQSSASCRGTRKRATGSRIRVEREGEQFTGTFRNVDGSAKVIDGKTCADVTSSLVVTVATAVDTTPKAPARVAPAPPSPPTVVHLDGGLIPVTFRAVDGRRLSVSVQKASGYAVASNGTGIAAAYFDNLCTSPCTAGLPDGRSYLTFADPDDSSFGGGQYLIDRPTTITLTHKSRHGVRMGLFIGGLAATGLGAFALTQSGLGPVVGGSLLLSTGITAISRRCGCTTRSRRRRVRNVVLGVDTPALEDAAQAACRAALRAGLRDADARDLAQDALVRALTSAQPPGGVPLAAWVYGIARNLGRDHAKSARSRELLVDVVPDAADDGDPATILAVRRAVHELPESLRDIITLHELEELSLRETAEALAIPFDTAKDRLRRAREQLRTRLGDADYTAERTHTRRRAANAGAAIVVAVLAAVGERGAAAATAVFAARASSCARGWLQRSAPRSRSAGSRSAGSPRRASACPSRSRPPLKPCASIRFRRRPSRRRRCRRRRNPSRKRSQPRRSTRPPPIRITPPSGCCSIARARHYNAGFPTRRSSR